MLTIDVIDYEFIDEEINKKAKELCSLCNKNASDGVMLEHGSDGEYYHVVRDLSVKGVYLQPGEIQPCLANELYKRVIILDQFLMVVPRSQEEKYKLREEHKKLIDSIEERVKKRVDELLEEINSGH